MAVTYEEALAALTSMFGSDNGSKWTTESLDQVLRHHQGHMENTIETVLQHGDGDPEVLLQRLRDPESVVRIDTDDEIARRLEQSSMSESQNISSSNENTKQAPNEDFSLPQVLLPNDFLRIPGYEHGEVATATNEAGMSDEQLAMMLQEQDLQEHLRRNPEFSHLAGQGQQQRQARSAGYPGSIRGPSNDEGPNIMENLSKMGENAKQKLALFASQINAKIDGKKDARNNNDLRNETRGLLDEGESVEEELVFSVSPASNEMEMKTIAPTSNWGESAYRKKDF